MATMTDSETSTVSIGVQVHFKDDDFSIESNYVTQYSIFSPIHITLHIHDSYVKLNFITILTILRKSKNCIQRTINPIK